MKSISQENIPELIEQILPIWKKEIERIQKLAAPSQAELKTSVELFKAMTQAYVLYRTLKAEIKREVAVATPTKLLSLLEQYKPKEDAKTDKN
jgi:hypothetical protein